MINKYTHSGLHLEVLLRGTLNFSAPLFLTIFLMNDFVYRLSEKKKVFSKIFVVQGKCLQSPPLNVGLHTLPQIFQKNSQSHKSVIYLFLEDFIDTPMYNY